MTRARFTPEAGRPSEERTKHIFSTIASEYDRFNKYSSMGIDKHWRKATVRLAHLKRSSEVLDLAAGTGDLTLALAENGSPARIMCTDLVPEMLEVAKAKAAVYEGSTKIEFDVVDAQAIPMPDESFDVVTVGFGVRNMPDRAANFSEVHRVLRPRGRYVVLEFSRPLFPPFRALYHFYLRTVIPMLGARLTGDRASFEYLNESILAFPGQVALAGELHKAGFSEVTWRNLTFGIVAVHVAVK